MYMENIRKDAIVEIKEKIKKNPGPSGYLHPCNRERQEDMRRLNFTNGYEFTYWMQQNKIMKNPTKVKQDNDDRLAREKGFANENEEQRIKYREYKNEWQINNRYNKGINIPMIENKDCSNYIGISIGENLAERFLLTIFECVNKMRLGYHEGGIDFCCKNPKKEFIGKYALEKNMEYRIQVKTGCLQYRYYGSEYWNFHIRYNNGPDYFLLIAFDDKENVDHMYSWFIHKNEKVRGKNFWSRDSLSMINKPSKLFELKKYELKDELDKLKELSNNILEEIE